MLVRHDACGLCFSDVKVIRAVERRPRIYRDMQPVVLGHEVSLTVVGVALFLDSSVAHELVQVEEAEQPSAAAQARYAEMQA